MKLPRDVSGADLAKALEKFGYEITRQTGSHMRLTSHNNGEHHLTIPAHDPIKIGTLNAILREVANHFGLDRDALLNQLFT
jgi:predicted RNA binding protein YcfA (HicA-like mRNA interferase family)